jgi:hypothetical protein
MEKQKKLAGQWDSGTMPVTIVITIVTCPASCPKLVPTLGLWSFCVDFVVQIAHFLPQPNKNLRPDLRAKQQAATRNKNGFLLFAYSGNFAGKFFSAPAKYRFLFVYRQIF